MMFSTAKWLMQPNTELRFPSICDQHDHWNLKRCSDGIARASCNAKFLAPQHLDVSDSTNKSSEALLPMKSICSKGMVRVTCNGTVLALQRFNFQIKPLKIKGDIINEATMQQRQSKNHLQPGSSWLSNALSLKSNL